MNQVQGSTMNGTQPSGRGQTLRGMMRDSFRGPTGWMAGVAWVYMLVFTVLAVLAAVWFFKADTTGDQLLYATIFLTLVVFTTATKMWYWMLMLHNGIRRDIERIESGAGR